MPAEKRVADEGDLARMTEENGWFRLCKPVSRNPDDMFFEARVNDMYEKDSEGHEFHAFDTFAHCEWFFYDIEETAGRYFWVLLHVTRTDENGVKFGDKMYFAEEVSHEAIKVILNGRFRVMGYECWYRNGKFHRDEDKPALSVLNGEGGSMETWYQDGKIHRDGDDPAVIIVDDSGERRIWCKSGVIHRDGDEPADVSTDGSKLWFKKGVLHRDGNEPAFIWGGKIKVWYNNGNRYRIESLD